MSLCLRTFPAKFTSFVNTRKQVTKIDRHLPKHVKSSLFLEEFLGTQAPTNVSNCAERSSNSIIYPVEQYLFISYLDQTIKWPKVLHKKYNLNPQRTVWLQKQRQRSGRTLSTIYDNVVRETSVNNSLQWPELCLDSNYFYKDKKSSLPYTEMLSVNRTSDVTLFDSENQSILYSEISPNVQNESKKQSPEDQKPSESQLQHVFDCLSRDLPMLFIRTMDYAIYTEDVVFVNNIRGSTSTGLHNYVKQIAFLKIIGHFKFAYVKLDILKITMHPEDHSIKVRWRIVGISGTNVFLSFWKFKVWNIKEYIHNKDAWYDGFSTFYVNNDGKIFKHVADKMMPDQDVCEKIKAPVDAKIALFTAL